MNPIHGFKNSYIRHLQNASSPLDPDIPGDLSVAAITYDKALSAMETLFNGSGSIRIADVEEVIDEVLQLIMDDRLTIRSLCNILHHDYYTHTHSVNVSIYAILLGKFLHLDVKTLHRLGQAGILHDIGKTSVDRRIINKPGRLTFHEFLLMQRHPEASFHAALSFGVRDHVVLSGIRYHHEKMDGSGYPARLQGDTIPFAARLIAVCDIFDALTTRRAYKPALSTLDAFEVMKSQMGRHLDMTVLDRFITLMGRPEEERYHE